MPGKIKVSSQCFSEIAQQLAKQGQEINKQGSVIIEKDMTIEQPYDFRLATIRKDCLVEATKFAAVADVIEVANNMFNFVLNGNIEAPVKKLIEKPTSQLSEEQIADMITSKDQKGWK